MTENEQKHDNSFCKSAECYNSAILKGLCPFCPTKLREINCLDEHVLDFHKPLLLAFEYANQLLLYPCPNNCGKSYKFKSSLNGHFKNECGKPPMYKCPYCKKRCTLKGNMKRHIVLVHHRRAVESDFNLQFTTKAAFF
ncbi:zinc finger protein syd-9-like [Rhopalosiphum padi]|uniref:zinc finger protein syd-9-like n=1 Tax=Rhopalosiphum padi TaxID=40932 RepID=UPI00298ECFD0|nr:zinc finger protein syd-9-like [Rhopalosiphum padi]